MTKNDAQVSGWIVCQIGARENYAIARALCRREMLAGLITDAWADPNALTSAMLPQRLQERWHAELRGEHVRAFSLTSAVRGVCDQLARRTGWEQIMARNAWFQKAAARGLGAFRCRAQTVFAYSYAAGDLFAEAKRRGWRTVLGQIDPGPVEARLVTEFYARAGQGHAHEPIPDDYWRLWRREIDLADRIVVNSEWSRRALLCEGVAEHKLVVIPLAYENTPKSSPRTVPERFSAERPLRLLFLGQVTLRKGIDLIFEALRRLPEAPLRLDIVGPLQVMVPEWIKSDPRVRLHGPVPRGATGPLYRQADLFLFPTRSDGFGLTQLEAMSYCVPVIASRACGDVVEDEVNGRLLNSEDPGELAALIRQILDEPARLRRMQEHARVAERFSLDAIGESLERLFA